MEIKDFKTEFSIGDIAWVMYNNRPQRAIISGVDVEFREVTYDIDNRTIPNLLKKIKSILGLIKPTIDVRYSLDIISKEDKFWCSLGGYYRINELGHTSEELYNKMLEQSK